MIIKIYTHFEKFVRKTIKHFIYIYKIRRNKEIKKIKYRSTRQKREIDDLVNVARLRSLVKCCTRKIEAKFDTLLANCCVDVAEFMRKY